jgi:hypothetical protein
LEDEEDDDELSVWLKERPFRLTGETLPQFWLRKRRQKSTARLAQMGLDMASIPAMSSDCERVFSQGKLLITGQRNRLRADIIEATQCLRIWLILDRKREGTWRGRGNWATPMELHNGGGDSDGGKLHNFLIRKALMILVDLDFLCQLHAQPCQPSFT